MTHRPHATLSHDVKQIAKLGVRAASAGFVRPRVFKQNKALKIDKHTLLVVDEAGLLPTETMRALVSAVQRGGGTLLLVGDPQQLPSIESGSPFAAIVERTGGGVTLNHIYRQSTESQKEDVRKLARGEGEAVLYGLARGKVLHVADNENRKREELVSTWKAESGRAGWKGAPRYYRSN